MRYIDYNNIKASQLVFGCMRISDMTVEDLEKLVFKAIDLGVNFFDHADIYGGGRSEQLFGEVLKNNPSLRDKIIIQSKCGIVVNKPINYYNNEGSYIIDSVNKSLERLNTSYLDVLLLHRPDTLFNPIDIANAFNELYKSNKVKAFGVSNMNSMQIELIQKHLDFKLEFNQLQFSPVHSGMVQNGLYVNMKELQSLDHDSSILEYCRLKDITIQAWSIMQASWAEGTFIDHPDYKELNDVLDVLSLKYNVTKNAIVVAWIVKHPANMQAIFGTTSIKHLEEMCLGCDIDLTHEEYYQILVSAMKVEQLP